MKNITIISGYYYPEDTAVGLYNLQMVEYLESKGYEVNVVTGFPNYPQWRIRNDYKDKKTFYFEKIGNTKIYRYKQYVPKKPTFFKRILLIIDFTIGSFFNVFKIKECDLVISVVPYTSTIFLGWILKLRKKSKLWIHIQDFEFDAVQETGIYFRKNKIKSLIFKLLFNLERKFLNLADINSTISYKMLEKLKSKSNKETFYFPNWIDANKINPSSFAKHNYMKSSKFKILYSGNIGEKQDWNFFLLFANEIRHYDAEIVLVGDGAKRKWLHEKVKDLKNVKLYEPVAYKDLSNLLCSADLHILFQKSNVVDSVMPSKILGMMASAKPSLITGSIKSEVRLIMEKSNGGFYVKDNNLEKCKSIVKNLIKSSNKSEQIGLYAREFIINKFSNDRIFFNFENKLSKILNN